MTIFFVLQTARRKSDTNSVKKLGKKRIYSLGALSTTVAFLCNCQSMPITTLDRKVSPLSISLPDFKTPPAQKILAEYNATEMPLDYDYEQIWQLANEQRNTPVLKLSDEVEMGYAYFEQKDFKIAEAYFKNVISSNRHFSSFDGPNSENYNQARLGLALVQIEYHEYDQAEILFKELLDVKSLSTLALTGLSYCYEKQSRFDQMFEFNKKLFFKTVATEPLQNMLKAALELDDQNKIDLTFEYLLLVRDEPYNVHMSMAQVAEKQNKFDLAIDEYKKAESYRIGDAAALKKILALNEQLGRKSEFIQATYLYQKYNLPESAMIEKAYAYSLKLNDVDLAMSFLDQLSYFYPAKKDYANFEKAQIYQQQNKAEKAIRLYQLIPESSLYYIQSQEYLSDLFWIQNKFSTSVDYLSSSAEKNNFSHLEQNEKLAFRLLAQDRISEAQSLLVSVIEKDPQRFQSHLLLAYCYAQNDDFNQFKVHIEKAQQLNPHNPEIYAVAADYWMKKGKPANEVSFLAFKANELKTKNEFIQVLNDSIEIDQNLKQEGRENEKRRPAQE